MTITATDFQLHVNEYFTRLMQGEEIIIERYGKKFAVLVSFKEYEKLLNEKVKPEIDNKKDPLELTYEGLAKTSDHSDLSAKEVVALLKKLLN